MSPEIKSNSQFGFTNFRRKDEYETNLTEMIEIKFTTLKFMIYNPEREKPTRPNPQIPEVDPDRKEPITKPNPRKPEIDPEHWEEKPTEPNPGIPERPPINPDKDDYGDEDKEEC